MEKARNMRTRLPNSLDLEVACRGINDLMSLYNLASRICPTRSKKIDCRLNSRTDKAFGCWGW